MPRTFKAQFGRGIECKVEVSDSPPEKGTTHIQHCEWIGKPTKRMIRQYIGWMNSVNKLLADEWNLKIMHCYQIERFKIETWLFEPSKQPKKVDTYG